MSSRNRTKAAGPDVLHVEVPASPRKKPRQARSVVLVDALKKAGWEILEKEGREALQVQWLSERSGVAVSSIYEYFPTMDSLIAAIFEDYRTGLRQEVLGKINALPPQARLFDGIVLALENGLGALHRWSKLDSKLSMQAAYFDELVRLDLVKPRNFWTAFLIPALVARFPDEVKVRDPEKAGFLAHQMVLALPRAVMLERPEYLAQADTCLLIASAVHALLTTNPE
ncbi:helix-turn-helix domain-containing protein [Variovorax humicola]|uniref:Helix-turn-helix domain-containing protein n=1 Tax=Variovorax humicola TaxID=1769758 RepID=A0ABU8VYY7_9BURK